MSESEIIEEALEPNESDIQSTEEELIPHSDEFSGQNPPEDEPKSEKIDYGELARRDMEELTAIFPHLSGKKSITELDNPLRYAALRDLGLSPKEAYLATAERAVRYDTRSHLCGSVPRAAGSRTDMISAGELEAARELFSGLSDREIQKLYKKVTR